MIPNSFGLIRQKDRSLIAAIFYPLDIDISEYEYEVIYPEYVDDVTYAFSGELQSRPGSAAASIPVSDFDWFLAPCSTKSTIQYTGLVGTSGNMITSVSYNAPATFPSKKNLYSMIYVPANANNLLVSVTVDTKELPVIGFRRHRSDNVNPKGIIKDVNSDILQPVKTDELNSEADGVRYELPGNTESPDIDSESGFGADERADG